MSSSLNCWTTWKVFYCYCLVLPVTSFQDLGGSSRPSPHLHNPFFSAPALNDPPRQYWSALTWGALTWAANLSMVCCRKMLRTPPHSTQYTFSLLIFCPQANYCNEGKLLIESLSLMLHQFAFNCNSSTNYIATALPAVWPTKLKLGVLHGVVKALKHTPAHSTS